MPALRRLHSTEKAKPPGAFSAPGGLAVRTIRQADGQVNRTADQADGGDPLRRG
jgi:hypothetical protein